MSGASCSATPRIWSIARDFVVPAYRWLDLPYYGIGLKAYDWLAGRSDLGASRWIGPAEVVARIPTISRRGLHGGIVYTDGQFDDARLAIALARTLRRPGRHRAESGARHGLHPSRRADRRSQRPGRRRPARRSPSRPAR